MSEITQLSPKAVWHFFDQICSIPHPSKYEEQLAQYIVSFAQAEGLDVRRDNTGNVIIKKPATAGMENRKGVVLQAHIDMVPQKNEETVHDFTQDPILPFIDGEWVTATGTTLGADNGMGMATCLAILAAKDIEHGPLEVLLTIDEEAGMTGAFGLEAGWLEGDILLNTDSEQEGEVYMGCAGGVDAALTVDIQREAIPAEHQAIKLVVKGLKGGHSGCDIHTGRGNANKLMARFFINHAEELGLRINNFTGGSLRNALPREASVIATLPAANIDQLNTLFAEYQQMVKAELGHVETDITIFTETCALPSDIMVMADQTRLMNILNVCPNGVIRMSDDIEGVVETSLNMGVITTEADKVTILCLIRSLIDSGRSYVEAMLQSLAALAGAKCEVSGAYPGWKPDADSEIMQVFRDTYQQMYGNKPNIMVIHAGLECGLFKEPYPEMDMLSFGPTIKFPHSPDEKVKIDTVQMFWDQMLAILKNIPVKK
ncbi:aminoacyl-histidine dipeptidase [Photobacterium kishitanii]|uniref:Cytosol non-specific dipeptidase n=1 Tax=Photobacterium kishitanii TaxID=318456 RepID=A0AAX0YZ62_9GAMM|nr:aminoacyl-histidine dipeptidase [Photobacterium kishitanii]KJG08723.1 aminoacyl-histidine dipeptidase [Photobacterium kishitanii]KJG57585.1 aminoacyl-histidine dipeptidase [Photobacterium kishitanii]KJG61243.1 aminoacyl-histidine dipeptidase [Photobacterium kishitanii]KJG65432.1 aminoacyl-histidine dipeptidase [Photobacterium kishitanii]KJG69535.1 aminoacyl-histidine dipeptidase [Photobacterium kishitanii]